MKPCRIFLLALLVLLPYFVLGQGSNKLVFNYGIKTGFQAITYNSIDFAIEGYRFNDNTIQSNKIGYTLTPFIRLTKDNFYVQTEAVFGVTRYKFDFYETIGEKGVVPNETEYNLTTYCVQVPLLVGYDFINYSNYGMSVFTGPKIKFLLTSLCDQEFSHFQYENLSEELNKRIFYWEFGLGVRIYNVFFDIVYDYGFTRNTSYITDADTGEVFASRRSDSALSFSIGFIF